MKTVKLILRWMILLPLAVVCFPMVWVIAWLIDQHKECWAAFVDVFPELFLRL